MPFFFADSTLTEDSVVEKLLDEGSAHPYQNNGMSLSYPEWLIAKHLWRIL